MKKIVSPELKAYKDSRDRKIIQIISPCGLLGIGIWMLISPSKPKHASIEKATVALLKDLWGFETGLVLLALGGLWMFFSIRSYLKFKKATSRPQ